MSNLKLVKLLLALGVSQVALVVQNTPPSAGDLRDMGSIHGAGRCPGGRHGNCLQYSCLENPMDRGAWRAVCRKQLDTTCSRASRLNGNNILVTQQRPVGSTCHQTHPLFLPDFLGSGLEHERERDCLQCQMGERRGTYHVLGPFHQFASECRDWQKTVRHE